MLSAPLFQYFRSRKGDSKSSTPLFQYWHDGKPPEEVARLISGWQAVPGFEHRLFDYEAAVAFITRHLGARIAACFQSCAVPAMQADLFRYVALFAEGGIYLDADNAPGPGDFAAFLDNVPIGLLCQRKRDDPPEVWFINDICYVRRPRHLLFRRVIDLACENIETRAGDTVWDATGPWLINRLREPQDEHLFKGLTVAWYTDMHKYVQPVSNLTYKKSSNDWREFYKQGRSMYV